MFVTITRYIDMENSDKYKLSLINDEWVLEPPGAVLLKNIISEPIFIDEGKKIEPSDKKKFLKNLYKAWNGSYISTSRAQNE